ncbi:MAG: helix-turn-helix domain-containing protein [Eubacterium sp.]
MEYLYNADGEYGKRGYLKEKYRVFNIRDKCDTLFDFHYHEFDKIVFFLSGDVNYCIEGREYKLEPYDILLVPHNEIHRPIINPNIEYERIIIWIDSNYINHKYNLSKCFYIAKDEHKNLIRLNVNDRSIIFDLVYSLVDCGNKRFADELLSETLFLQILISINRRLIENKSGVNAEYKSDRQIDDIIDFINKNLFDDLSVDKISKEFYISRYHLMRKFKALTGKSIFSYIQTKRLLNAAYEIEHGSSASMACYDSGYSDYSVFLKAFKKEFGVTPTQYSKRTQEK